MITYDETWLLPLIFRCKGSVSLRAAFYALPASCLASLLIHADEILPGFRSSIGIEALTRSHIWGSSTVVLTFLLGFRARQGLSRFWEGTGLLHQMRGEWFDTVSNCVTFSIAARKTKPVQVTKFRHSLVRLMSLCHASALEEISGDSVQMSVIDLHGLDEGTLKHLFECSKAHNFNRVEVCLHLLQSLITSALDEGILKIPPPILSRVYQTISRGFVNLLNTKKITDTKFPFPFAQVIAMFLIMHTLLAPLIVAAVTPNAQLAALFTFIPVFGMFSLNFISIELENPFGTDANDLPLEEFQKEMNSCLLMLLHPNTDLVPATSSTYNHDFNSLLEEFKHDNADNCKRLGAQRELWSPRSQKQSMKRQDSQIDGQLDAILTAKEEEKLAQKSEPAAAAAAAAAAAPAAGDAAAGVVPASEAESLQRQLAQGMQQFGASLQQFMTVVNSQNQEMNKAYTELSQCCERIPTILNQMESAAKKKPMSWEAPLVNIL